MSSPPASRLTLHQVVMLVLAIYVLVALLIRESAVLDVETRELLDWVDTGICVYFLYDFSLRFYQAPNKLRFMRWGWIDLLASLPAIGWGRLGQLVRVVRILRMIRAFRTTRAFLTYVFRNRANGTLTVVFLSAGLLLIFGSVAVLYVERTVTGANIKTPVDALWWAFVTITTVGYGDRFPVTIIGRAIAVVLILMGVGLFGTFTGYIANFFVEQEQQVEESEIHRLIEEVRRLRTKIEDLEKRLD